MQRTDPGDLHDVWLPYSLMTPASLHLLLGVCDVVLHGRLGKSLRLSPHTAGLLSRCTGAPQVVGAEWVSYWAAWPCRPGTACVPVCACSRCSHG